MFFVFITSSFNKYPKIIEREKKYLYFLAYQALIANNIISFPWWPLTRCINLFLLKSCFDMFVLSRLKASLTWLCFGVKGGRVNTVSLFHFNYVLQRSLLARRCYRALQRSNLCILRKSVTELQVQKLEEEYYVLRLRGIGLQHEHVFVRSICSAEIDGPLLSPP